MNPTLKAAWLARLRDPAARQCFGTLCDGSGAMCALGHLLDVAGFDVSDEDAYSELKSIGMDDDERIEVWNDDQMLTLPQIADHVESELP